MAKRILITSDTFGKADAELGAILMRSFLVSLAHEENAPAAVMFSNDGVKLACEGSDALGELRLLEEAGVTITACGHVSSTSDSGTGLRSARRATCRAWSQPCAVPTRSSRSDDVGHVVPGGSRLETPMPLLTIDLHNHTPLIPTDYRGDPATTPRQIVERALEVGIDVWGIADHWSVSYGRRVVEAAREVFAESGRRLLVLPGAELRIRHNGEETHMVALFPPGEEVERFAALLASLGLEDPVAPLAELPFFAHDRDPLEVARLVEEAGGMCHIGHVDRAFGDYCFIESDLVHDLAECEHISAVELIDHSCRSRFRDGLAVAYISSSDSHSLEEMGRRTATIELAELSFEGLRSAFRAARGLL